VDLDAVTTELYGGELEDFTSKRTALSKQARAEGDKALAQDIGKLRKPSTSAWAINTLVRSSPDEVDRLLDLGAAFRQAQDDLDGPELRGLSRQRQALIGAVVESVRELAGDQGRPISEAMAAEIEQTFRAAMADPDAAEAVRGGALTTAISGSGLGSLKISDVAASTTPVLELVRGSAKAGSARKPAKQKSAKPSEPSEDDDGEDAEARRARTEAAAAAAEELELAKQAATAATDRLTAAGEAVERASAARDELQKAIDDLRKRLAAAEAELLAADDTVSDAEQDRETAKAAAAEAEAGVEQARAALPDS